MVELGDGTGALLALRKIEPGDWLAVAPSSDEDESGEEDEDDGDDDEDDEV